MSDAAGFQLGLDIAAIKEVNPKQQLPSAPLADALVKI